MDRSDFYVGPPPKVLIPDSSLEFIGPCGEKICLQFPKASDEDVKALIDGFLKGFNGFNRDQGEKVLRSIARLKKRYWKLRRSYMHWYPEFREEVIEGLPFPEDFNGFTLEESKEILRVFITLDHAYSRSWNYLKKHVHEASKGLQRSEASGSHPPGTFRPPTSHISFPQHQASTLVPGSHQQFNGYGQIPPYWHIPVVPFGYANCPLPYMGSRPGNP